MLFLVKPDELLGFTHHLDSPEYLAIKEEALSELKARQEVGKKAEARRRTAYSELVKSEKDINTLFDMVKRHVLSVIREESPKPLT